MLKHRPLLAGCGSLPLPKRGRSACGPFCKAGRMHGPETRQPRLCMVSLLCLLNMSSFFKSFKRWCNAVRFSESKTSAMYHADNRETTTEDCPCVEREDKGGILFPQETHGHVICVHFRSSGESWSLSFSRSKFRFSGYLLPTKKRGPFAVQTSASPSS